MQIRNSNEDRFFVPAIFKLFAGAGVTLGTAAYILNSGNNQPTTNKSQPVTVRNEQQSQIAFPEAIPENNFDSVNIVDSELSDENK